MNTQIRISKKHNVAVLPYCARVAGLIPHNKKFAKGGTDFIMVPAGKEELQLLRNLGYATPSPMQLGYDWCGMVPFDSQMMTADMLIHSPRAYVLNEMGCVDSETEYLTPSGWRRIADYDSTDGGGVAQYNPETGEAEFVMPEEWVKLPCSTMLRLKHSRGLDQMLSPEHRVLLHSRLQGRDKLEVIAATDLYERGIEWEAGEVAKRSATKIGFTQATIPTTFSLESDGMALGDAYIRVMVAVIADGYFPNESNRCIVRLKKERKRYRLALLLKQAGIEFSCSPCKPAGFYRFSFIAPRHEKHFGRGWWNTSSAQRLIIADEAMHWDGSTDGIRFRFSSYIEASAEFIQFTYTSLGFTTRLTKVTRQRRGKEETEYIVTPRDASAVGIMGKRGQQRLTNMDVVPSTDGFKYCFRVPSTFLVFRRNGCIFLSGNTGKTLSALFAYDYLKKHKLVRKMLVVAPLSTLTTVWEREVFTRLPHLTTQSLWHPTAARRRQYLEADADIFVINHDGLGTIMPELLAKKDIDVVLIDELAIFRKKSTDRWKRTNAICQGKKFVWGMTGSPTPKAPSDAWAQTVLITPDRVPKYFRQFRDRVETQVSQFRWIPKHDANDTVHDAMQPCVRYTREDCLDLPETMYTTREVAFTKEQTTLYKQMVASSYAKYLDGEINAANAGIVTSKLLQISCGIAYDIHGETIHVPSKPRMTELEGILEGNEHKIIVFVPFIKAVDAVFDMVIAAGYDAARIYGATPKLERDQTFNLFQNSPSIRVLVAHPQTMAHGLTLTAADTIVWYSPTPSLEIYEQANARITRPGQKNRTHIVHIESSPIERKIYKNLTNRGHVQSVLLDMFAETTPQNLQAI